jgi:hypothetical protein
MKDLIGYEGYTVVRESHFDSFQAVVNNFLSSGYTLIGGVSTAPNPYSGAEFYIQAVAKPIFYSKAYIGPG